MIEPENIFRILKETKDSIQKNDFSRLKELSNQTIHSASISQDQDNISVAVTVYSIGKIFERLDYKSLPGWNNFQKVILDSLDKSIKYLGKNDLENFRFNFSFLGKAINKISGKLKIYINDVFEKAKINKASRMHEHGISLGQTAKLLGISLYELAGYTGNTGIAEVNFGRTLDEKSRIKLVEDIFK
jgi:hypothetical protein